MKKAFTLIELMVAMTLSLLLLLAVAKMFQGVGDTINDTQATLNMAANMNNVAMILREDLDAIVRCTEIDNPHNMVQNQGNSTEAGYFEIIEGDNSEITYVDSDNGNAPDPTVGDVNDILMGTGKVVGANRNYRGLINGTVTESNYAEIIWFVRGTTLYRQTKLIIGGNNDLIRDRYNLALTDSVDEINLTSNFLADNDISVSPRDSGGGTPYVRFNTLGNLTRREFRFAHRYVGQNVFPFPHDPKYQYLRLPTMAELDRNQWRGLSPITPPAEVDLWKEPNYATGETIQEDGWLGTPGPRAGEDVVLTNVISFDVRVWNHETQSFVNLGDGSTGAFGSQGRYSGRTNPDGTSIEHERLVTKVNFDENKDNFTHLDPGRTTPNPSMHDSDDDYLYVEDSGGRPLPLSNLDLPPLPPGSPSSPPSPPGLPQTTLEIGAWPPYYVDNNNNGQFDAGDTLLGNWRPMPRVFDTFSSAYERDLRVGGMLVDVSDMPVDFDSPASPDYLPPSTDICRKIGATQDFSLTQFNVVTFAQTPLPTNTALDRWDYRHSPKYDPPIPNLNPPPATTNGAQKLFERHTHQGTGTFINKTSGAYWETPPPYDERLRGIEITIRCFDPKSGNIRQVRVVKNMR